MVMDHTQPFSDPASVAGYAESTPQRVPGYADLHRMVQILLSEQAPANARILVLGAGGGLELRALATACPDWTFAGVDPSLPMLDLAARVLGPLHSRVDLVNGYAADAPPGPFDGATCLLTLHFLSRPSRLAVLREMNQRLKPGAPLALAHHCHPHPGPVEDWLARSAGFAAGQPSGSASVKASAANMAQHLTLLTPEEEETLLREAGFIDPALVYAALSFRGWVAYAAPMP